MRKADEVPQALVEEGRMDVHSLRPAGQAHAAEDVGLVAEGVAVYEDWPTTMTWPSYQRGAAHVERGPMGIFLQRDQTMTVRTPAMVPPYMAMPPSQILKMSIRLSL